MIENELVLLLGTGSFFVKVTGKLLMLIFQINVVYYGSRAEVNENDLVLYFFN